MIGRRGRNRRSPITAPLLAGFLMASPCVLAADRGSSVPSTVDGTVPTVSNPPTPSSRSVTTTESSARLSATHQFRAQLWELSETEWRRYLDLMQGIRGSISPATISPVEVLGIHARNPGERRHYAKRWARVMTQDARRILAFQRAYDAAIRQVQGGEPLINRSRLSRSPAPRAAFDSQDRLLFFTQPDCPACDRVMRRLMERLDEYHGLDIYLVNLTPDDDAAVRRWARAQAIDPELVRSRRVTLNHNRGALQRWVHPIPDLPVVFRLQGNELMSVLPADLRP